MTCIINLHFILSYALITSILISTRTLILCFFLHGIYECTRIVFFEIHLLETNIAWKRWDYLIKKRLHFIHQNLWYDLIINIAQAKWSTMFMISYNFHYRWNNFVFLSPSLIQISLDFCFHVKSHLTNCSCSLSCNLR